MNVPSDRAGGSSKTKSLGEKCTKIHDQRNVRYNSAYYCNASISFVKGESPDMSVVKVQYQVRGDNSLGPLQDPEDSSFSVDQQETQASQDTPRSRVADTD